MIEYKYLLKIVDPERGFIVQYKKFKDPKIALQYFINKCEEDKIFYDHYLKRIEVEKK